MTRLYQISITHTSVVAADNEDEAWGVAHDQAGDILGEEEYQVDVDHEITRAEALPNGWNVKCHPWGSDGVETVETILTNLTPSVVRDTKTIDMFPEPV